MFTAPKLIPPYLPLHISLVTIFPSATVPFSLDCVETKHRRTRQLTAQSRPRFGPMQRMPEIDDLCNVRCLKRVVREPLLWRCCEELPNEIRCRSPDSAHLRGATPSCKGIWIPVFHKWYQSGSEGIEAVSQQMTNPTFEQTTARSRELYARALHVLPAGVSYKNRFLEPYPFYVESAHGSKVVDLEGNQYTDYWCTHFSMILGHSHPKVRKALERQHKKGWNFGLVHELEVRHA